MTINVKKMTLYNNPQPQPKIKNQSVTKDQHVCKLPTLHTPEITKWVTYRVVCLTFTVESTN